MMSDTPRPTPVDDLPPEEAPNKWYWRNCRSVSLAFQFWLWPWHVGARREEDVHSGIMAVAFGPFGISIEYSIGNYSADAPANWFALCEIEAEERAARYSRAADHDMRVGP